MTRSIKSFCNGQRSTSTLRQRRPSEDIAAAMPTLEEMILRLEIEEAIAAAKRSGVKEEGDYYGHHDVAPRRRSCVDSSDRILRTAKDALNQYPRFSLDGKDAMCRNFTPQRPSLLYSTDRNGRRSCGGDCVDDDGYLDKGEGVRKKKLEQHYPLLVQRKPRTVAGEAVVWCKPGVVAKLMGLEALPVPLRRGKLSTGGGGGGDGRKRRDERREKGRNSRGGRAVGLGSESGCGRPRYCAMKPITMEPLMYGPDSPTRFLL